MAESGVQQLAVAAAPVAAGAADAGSAPEASTAPAETQAQVVPAQKTGTYAQWAAYWDESQTSHHSIPVRPQQHLITCIRTYASRCDRPATAPSGKAQHGQPKQMTCSSSQHMLMCMTLRHAPSNAPLLPRGANLPNDFKGACCILIHILP